MYEGQELYHKLSEIYNIMNRYIYDVEQYVDMCRRVRQEKRYTDTESVKGKRNISIAVCIAVSAAFTLVLDLIAHDLGNIGWIAIVIIVYFMCKNIYPKVSIVAICLLLFQYVLQVISVIQSALSGDWVGIIFLLISVMIAVFIIRAFFKVNSFYVDSYNKDIQEFNSPYIQKYNEMRAESEELDRRLQSEIRGWFPPNYVNVNAIAFFMNALANGKATTMKELVNMYDEQMKHEEIVRGQREQIALTREMIYELQESTRNITQELQFSNMIGAFQCIQLYDIRKHM